MQASSVDLLEALHAHLMSTNGRFTLKVMVTAAILQLRVGTVLLNEHLLFILASLSFSSHLASYIFPHLKYTLN